MWRVGQVRDICLYCTCWWYSWDVSWSLDQSIQTPITTWGVELIRAMLFHLFMLWSTYMTTTIHSRICSMFDQRCGGCLETVQSQQCERRGRVPDYAAGQQWYVVSGLTRVGCTRGVTVSPASTENRSCLCCLCFSVFFMFVLMLVV